LRTGQEILKNPGKIFRKFFEKIFKKNWSEIFPEKI